MEWLRLLGNHDGFDDNSPKATYGVVANNNDGNNDKSSSSSIIKNHDGNAAMIVSRMELDSDDAMECLGYGPCQQHILVAVGFCFASSSVEMLLFSILAVVLKQEWNLTEQQTNALSGAVFVGGLAGNLILGPLGDAWGRKPVLVWTAAILSIFGLATAACLNYYSLLLCRFAVGFAVGGLAVSFDALAEFMPTARRGTHLLFVEYFWTVGTILVPAIAYLCLSVNNNNNSNSSNNSNNNSNAMETCSGGWRLFCALCAVPGIMATFAGYYLVPESPRWLLLQGRHDQALQILRHAAGQNGQNPTKVFPASLQLVVGSDAEADSNVCDLFSAKWYRTTLLLWCVWGCQYFVYFGAAMAVTLVFVEDKGSSSDGNSRSMSPEDDDAEYYEFDFEAIFVSALAETAGTTVIIYLIDRIGRIPSQALSYLLGGISVFVLCQLAAQKPQARLALMGAAFVARLALMAGTCATWVFTAEILTTEIRTTGHTWANAVGSLTGAFSPYVVSPTTSFATIGWVILLLSVFTAFFVVLLPETKGKSMGLPSQKRRST